MSDRLLKESDVLRAVDERIEELSKSPVFVRKNGRIDVLGIKDYILAIPSADKWIPCSERMPSKGIAALVNVIIREEPLIVISTDVPYDYERGWINAWMPLPEPWKGVDNAQ